MNIPTPQEQFARARALREKFYPTIPPVIARRTPPRVVELIRTTYDHCRKAGAVVVAGRVYGPFPMGRDFIHVSSDTIGGTNPRAIMSRIATAHGLCFGDLTGPRRTHKIVNARHEAICAVRDARPDLSLPQIGALFAKNHTSILSALRKHGRT